MSLSDDLKRKTLRNVLNPEVAEGQVAPSHYDVPEDVVDRMIFSSLELMRSAGYRSDESIVVLAQLLAWIKISDSNGLPNKYNLLSVMNMNPNGIEDQLKAGEDYLTGSNDTMWQVAFVGLRNRLRPFRRQSTLNVIDPVKHILSWGSLDYRMVARAILRNWVITSDAFTVIPNEVATLCADLLDSASHGQVYCPFLPSLHLALAASSARNDVFFEIAERDPLVASIAILWGEGFEVRFSDPILAPTFCENARLQEFPRTLACTQFGFRRTLPDFDVFGRFEGRNAFSETVDLKHVLAQTSGRAVVIVPSGWLGRTQPADRQFKEELVRNGWLRAVIALRDGLLNTTGIPISILVIDKQNPSRDVLFIDARGDEFVQPRKERRYSRVRLVNEASITDIFAAHKPSEISELGDLENCRKHDFDLSVNHYVFGREQKRLEEKLKSRENTALHKLVVDIVRGQAVKPGSGAFQLEFGEVTAEDIDEADGSVRAPRQKRVYVDPKELGNRSFHNQILRPGDIVLAVKGSLGRVGLVTFGSDYKDGWLVPTVRMSDFTEVSVMDSNVPHFLEPTNWIVGQSYVIIRANTNIIDPIVLFMYLRSEIAQQWINSKGSGSTVPLLKQQYLENLPVVLPTADEAERVRKRYFQTLALARQLDELKRELKLLAAADWP